MKKNKILKLTALGLAVAVTATGTLAYLKNSTTAVTNTFAAAELLEKDPADHHPLISLDETEVEYDEETNTYRPVGPDARTNSNTYNKIIPGVPVMKDPVLKINLEQDINAYVYLEVVEEDMCDDLVYDIRREWIPLLDEHGDQVVTERGVMYYHEGDDEVTNPGVLRDDSERGNTGERTYYILENDEIRPNPTATCTTPGHAHYSGKLHFYGYVCQAAGFATPAEAFKKVFK